MKRNLIKKISLIMAFITAFSTLKLNTAAFAAALEIESEIDATTDVENIDFQAENLEVLDGMQQTYELQKGVVCVSGNAYEAMSDGAYDGVDSLKAAPENGEILSEEVYYPNYNGKYDYFLYYITGKNALPATAQITQVTLDKNKLNLSNMTTELVRFAENKNCDIWRICINDIYISNKARSHEIAVTVSVPDPTSDITKSYSLLSTVKFAPKMNWEFDEGYTVYTTGGIEHVTFSAPVLKSDSIKSIRLVSADGFEVIPEVFSIARREDPTANWDFWPRQVNGKYQQLVKTDNYGNIGVVAPAQLVSTIDVKVKLPKDAQRKNYDVILTFKSGNVYRLKYGVEYTDKAIVSHAEVADTSLYGADSTGGYVAMMIYGVNLTDTMIPTFYKDENCTQKVLVWDKDSAMSAPIPGGRVYKLKKAGFSLGSEITTDNYQLNTLNMYFRMADRNGASTGIVYGPTNAKAAPATYESKMFYSTYVSHNSDSKRMRFNFYPDFVKKMGFADGEPVYFKCYVDEWAGGSKVKVPDYHTAPLNVTKDGKCYVDAPVENLNNFGEDYAYGEIEIGDWHQRYSFSNISIRKLDNLDCEGMSFRIYAQDDLGNILAEGENGTRVLSAADRERLYDAGVVRVEIFNINGSLRETFLASFSSIKYDTITYEYNGGKMAEGVANPDTVKKGSPVILKDPVKNNSDFLGWYKDPEFTEKVTRITAVGGKNITLYAKWRGHKYDLRLTDGKNEEVIPIYYGEKVTISASKFVLRGYEIKGWALTAIDATLGNITYNDSATIFVSDLVEKTEPLKDKISLYPVWGKRDYKITYELNGAGSKVSKAGWPYTYQLSTASLRLPVAEDIQGFKFGGWYTNPAFTKSSYIYYIPDHSVGDVTLYAKWIPDKIKITFDSNAANYPGLTINGSVDSITAEYGRYFNLPANAYTVITKGGEIGYGFSGWALNPKGRPVFDNLDKCSFTEDTTLYAVFAPVGTTYKIVYKDISGIINAPDLPDEYEYGAGIVRIPNPVKYGYDFLGWTNAQGMQVTQIDENASGKVTLTAHWSEKKYNIVFKRDGGKGTVSDKRINYSGSIILPKNGVFTRAGYRMSGLIIDNGTDTKLVDAGIIFNPSDYNQLIGLLKSNSTVKIRPNWVADVYSITYDCVGGIAIPSSSYNYNPSGVTEVSVPTRNGFDFAGWYLDKDCKKAAGFYQNGRAFIKKGISGDITLYAKWTGDYKIILHGPAGSENIEITGYKAGKPKAIAKNTFKKEGEVFAGWSTSANDNTVVYKDREKIRDDERIYNNTLDLYAVFGSKFNLYFDPGDKGTTTRYAYTYTYGRSIGQRAFARLSEPERGGYTFMGWYRDPGYKVRMKSLSKFDRGDIYLYAKWKPSAIKIVYRATAPAGTKLKGSMSAQKSTFGKNVEVKNCNFSAPGYRFAGWEWTKPGIIVSRIPVAAGEIINGTPDEGDYPENGTIILNASWEMETYSITYYDGAEEMTAAENPNASVKTYTVVSDEYVLKNPQRLGYSFQGWYTTKQKGGKRVYSIPKGSSGDMKLYARWL